MSKRVRRTGQKRQCGGAGAGLIASRAARLDVHAEMITRPVHCQRRGAACPIPVGSDRAQEEHGEMDAADLRVFQSVAGTGSMNKAALALNTVQSNVTARIKALEDEVGFALFERTNRGVTLTDAGRRLLPFAARAARLLDDAKCAVADQGTPAGALSVGSLETTAALRLSPVLAEFAAAYPAVDLCLRT